MFSFYPQGHCPSREEERGLRRGTLGTKFASFPHYSSKKDCGHACEAVFTAVRGPWYLTNLNKVKLIDLHACTFSRRSHKGIDGKMAREGKILRAKKK